MLGGRCSSRMLRAPAHLAGTARRGPRASREDRGRLVRRSPAAGERFCSCEPSCLSSVKEDVRRCCAASSRRRARTVAAACCFSKNSRAASICRSASGPTKRLAPRPLPSEIDGIAGGLEIPASADSRRDHRRSRCRLLRHGGLVRLHARALRCFGGDRRTASCCPR